MKKVLFTATVDSHILHFHIPYLKYFHEQGYEVHVATNGTEEIPFCDKKIVIPFERSPYKTNNIKAIFQLKKIIEKEQYELIHTHTPMGSVVTRIAAKKARKKNGTKVLYTAHGFHFYKGAPMMNWLLFYPVEKILSNYTDTLITINKEDYELARKKFKKTTVRYIPGVGIDEEKFSFKMSEQEKKELRNSLNLTEEDFVMIYPAELSERKRQLWLVETIAPLIKEFPQVHLLLPGRDSLNGKCDKLIRQLNMDHNIHLLGFRKDIPRLLKISDLAVSSSKQEGLPVNLLEAIYVGLPLVVSDCRGNRDLVIEGSNGYIIGTSDEEEFNRKLKIFLLQKNDVMRNTNKNKDIIKEFLLENVLTKMDLIYKEILNEKNTSPIS